MPDNLNGSIRARQIHLLAALILTLLYGIFLQGGTWGLGFPILISLIAGANLLINPSLRNRTEPVLYLGLSVILAWFLAIRSFWLGPVLTIPTVIMLLALATIQAAPNHQPLNVKTLIAASFWLIYQAFAQLFGHFHNLKSIIPSFSQPQKGFVSTRKLSLGIGLAIPLVIVFTALFASADPLFARYLQDLGQVFKFKLDSQLIFRSMELVLVLGVISTFISAKGATFSEFLVLSKLERVKTEVIVAISIVSVLVALFLIVQAQYLFATDQILKQLGMMYSEYTRKGYFELLVVSFISMSLVGIYIKGFQKTDPTFMKTISLLFILEVFLLLVSATRRTYLYQDIFGFTHARIMGFLFSLWLTGILSLFSTKILNFVYKFNLTKALIINSVLVLILMHLINIDYLVGVVKQPNLGYGVDHRYVMSISADAWQGWDKSLQAIEQNPHCSVENYVALGELQLQHEYLKNQSQNNWHRGGGWVYSNTLGLAYLDQNRDRIDKLYKKHFDCMQVPPR